MPRVPEHCLAAVSDVRYRIGSPSCALHLSQQEATKSGRSRHRRGEELSVTAANKLDTVFLARVSVKPSSCDVVIIAGFSANSFNFRVLQFRMASAAHQSVSLPVAGQFQPAAAGARVQYFYQLRGQMAGDGIASSHSRWSCADCGFHDSASSVCPELCVPHITIRCDLGYEPDRCVHRHTDHWKLLLVLP